MVSAFLLVKVVHVLAAMVWLGMGVFQAAVGIRLAKRQVGKPRVLQIRDSFAASRPIVATAAAVTVVFGWDLARRLFGTANPVAWAGAGSNGPLVLAGLGLALAAGGVSVALARLERRLSGLIAGPWTPESEREADATISALVATQHSVTLLVVVVAVLMVASNVGGF